MSGLDRLPPDQRALLELILARGLGYDDLAGPLGTDREAVRERARAALDALVPDDVPRPPERDREGLADFLLGQHEGGPPAALGSPDGRAWTRAAAGALSGTLEPATAPRPRAGEDAYSPAYARRMPDLVVPFAIYCVLIAAGLVTYAVVGLTHH